MVKAKHSIHEFVKVNLVRATVNDCIEPYCTKLRMKDKEIRFQKQEIRELQASVKGVEHQCMLLVRNKKQTDLLQRQFKEFKKNATTDICDINDKLNTNSSC